MAAEYVVLLIIFLVMFGFYLRFNSFFKATMFGVTSGLIFMCAILYLKNGLLAFNLFTVLTSIVAGVPGVLSLILLNSFLA